MLNAQWRLSYKVVVHASCPGQRRQRDSWFASTSNKRNETKKKRRNQQVALHSTNVLTQSKPNRFVRVNTRVNRRNRNITFVCTFGVSVRVYVMYRWHHCVHHCTPFRSRITPLVVHRLSVGAASDIHRHQISQTMLRLMPNDMLCADAVNRIASRNWAIVEWEDSASCAPSATSDKATADFAQNNETWTKNGADLVRWK